MENRNIILRKSKLIKDNSDEVLKDIFVGFNTLEKKITPQKNMLEEFINIIKSSNLGDKIYILSPRLNLMKIKKYINEALDRGVVFYAILQDASLLEEYFGKILIRESSNLPKATFILSENKINISGVLSQGNLDETFRYILRIDQEQFEDLKRLFVNIFWNKSQFEFREMGRIKAKSLYENYLYNELIEGSNQIIDTFENVISHNTNIYSKYLDNINYKQLTESTLQIEKKDLKNIDYIKNIAYKNNDIFINSNHILSHFLFTNNEGYYISDFENSKNTFIISLNNSQLREVNEYKDILKSNPDYIFFKEIKIKDLNNNFLFLDNLTKEIERKNRSIKKLEPVNTQTIEEYLNFDIDEYIKSLMQFNQSDIALEYEYNLEVYPPYLPKKATKAPLIKEWEIFDKNFKGFLNKEILNLIEDKKSIETRKTALFKLFQAPKLNKLNSDIEKLKTIKSKDFLLLEYTNLKKILKEVEEITNSNIYNKDEIKLKDEEEKLQNKIKQFEDKIQALEDELKKYNTKITLNPSRILIKKISEFQNDRQLKSKNNKKIFISNLKESKKILKNIEKEKENLKSYKMNLEINKKQLNNLCNSSKKSNFNISLPSIAKNTIGNLYEYENKIYLSILKEDDLFKALDEAKRLNAKVVFQKC